MHETGENQTIPGGGELRTGNNSPALQAGRRYPQSPGGCITPPMFAPGTRMIYRFGDPLYRLLLQRLSRGRGS